MFCFLVALSARIPNLMTVTATNALYEQCLCKNMISGTISFPQLFQANNDNALQRESS